jgi:hypothetical protein
LLMHSRIGQIDKNIQRKTSAEKNKHEYGEFHPTGESEFGCA